MRGVYPYLNQRIELKIEYYLDHVSSNKFFNKRNRSPTTQNFILLRSIWLAYVQFFRCFFSSVNLTIYPTVYLSVSLFFQVYYMFIYSLQCCLSVFLVFLFLCFTVFIPILYLDYDFNKTIVLGLIKFFTLLRVSFHMFLLKTKLRLQLCKF